MNRAVFLDRDGVIIRDNDLMTTIDQVQVLDGVPLALSQLKRRGFKLIVVSNQSVVARGMLDEAGVDALNAQIQEILRQQGGPTLDGWRICPHHPNATLIQYRMNCECRKPKPGLILNAAHQLNINLFASFLVGDRISDISAGNAAGCKTVLVETGKHLDPPIETVETIHANTIKPHFQCKDLVEAAAWILRQP
jgi:D-glycero-D-manno-heptose 1,7-bisphosphate phosphatase